MGAQKFGLLFQECLSNVRGQLLVSVADYNQLVLTDAVKAERDTAHLLKDKRFVTGQDVGPPKSASSFIVYSSSWRWKVM